MLPEPIARISSCPPGRKAARTAGNDRAGADWGASDREDAAGEGQKSGGKGGGGSLAGPARTMRAEIGPSGAAPLSAACVGVPVKHKASAAHTPQCRAPRSRHNMLTIAWR